MNSSQRISMMLFNEYDISILARKHEELTGHLSSMTEKFGGCWSPLAFQI